ncbi:uncharacterized protein LOC114324412 [Diabrotica virgifera virgifera]|uniref:Uncharacterized protein n=1 Tax=Diabrotica virgifera virgifera TaxID=50390 RepID=A0ABM5I9K8_DIAVI|nr:uncharacterized protein LOC114324412 [Diabrotica virgifera virgifera]
MSLNTLKKCTQKEGMQRMNYLYQICNLMITENRTNNAAAAAYSNLLNNISRKTVQRLEIDMKRTICKACVCLLIVGVTAKIAIKKKKRILTCLRCNHSKIYIINK